MALTTITVEAMAAEVMKLDPHQQYAVAELVASNIGYVLRPETYPGEAEDRDDLFARLLGGA